MQENVASTYLGQFLFSQYIKVMDTLKGVAEYNPEHKKDDDNPTVDRHLSWLIFIPIVFALRLIRLGLSLVALVFRRSPVTRNDVVGHRILNN